MSAGTTSDAVVQLALPVEDTVTVGQSLIAPPFTVKDTVPLGMTGESVPESCAVKVTDVPTLTEPEGEGVKPSVGVSAFTVCVVEELVGLAL